MSRHMGGGQCAMSEGPVRLEIFHIFFFSSHFNIGFKRNREDNFFRFNADAKLNVFKLRPALKMEMSLCICNSNKEWLSYALLLDSQSKTVSLNNNWLHKTYTRDSEVAYTEKFINYSITYCDHFHCDFEWKNVANNLYVTFSSISFVIILIWKLNIYSLFKF